MVGFRTSDGLLAVLLTVLIGTIMLAIPLLSSSPVHADLTSHAPIYINGNDNFTLANGVTSGSGYENDPYIIENWDINAWNANGIEITNTTAYFVIRNCHIHDGMHSDRVYNYGILVENVANGEIENNIETSNYSGVYLRYSHNNLIENNIVENNSYEWFENPHGNGILLYTSNNNLILNNILRYNADSDIGLEYSDNNLIENNIAENIFMDSGIYLRYSHNNLVKNNLVKNSDYYGIFLNFSDNNLIYHNNLVNNWQHAYDGGSNSWDNGYPSGGNYWSNYSGTDYFRGENQDISGSDGIWDNSYYIAGGGNLDRYPIRMLSSVAGWNLLGFSIENTPNNTFTTLSYYTDYIIYYWNAPGGPYNIQDPDTAFKDNVGYWVWLNQNKTVGTSGTRPVSENIHLVPGWNLVSFPVIDNVTTPNKIFAPLNCFENYIIYWWTAPGGPYNIQDPNTVLNDNIAYWVWMDQDKTVTVP